MLKPPTLVTLISEPEPEIVNQTGGSVKKLVVSMIVTITLHVAAGLATRWLRQTISEFDQHHIR